MTACTTWHDNIWSLHILYAQHATHITRTRAAKQVNQSSKLRVDIVWLDFVRLLSSRLKYHRWTLSVVCHRWGMIVPHRWHTTDPSPQHAQVACVGWSSSCFPTLVFPLALYQWPYVCLHFPAPSSIFSWPVTWLLQTEPSSTHCQNKGLILSNRC